MAISSQDRPSAIGLKIFAPWVVLYKHHLVAAAIYYGVILTVLLLVGLALVAAQRRLASTRPFGGSVGPTAPADHEHFR